MLCFRMSVANGCDRAGGALAAVSKPRGVGAFAGVPDLGAAALGGPARGLAAFPPEGDLNLSDSNMWPALPYFGF